MKLKKYMRINDISVRRAASDLGVTPTYLSYIRQGRRPGVDLAEKIEEWSCGKVSAVELLKLSKRSAA